MDSCYGKQNDKGEATQISLMDESQGDSESEGESEIDGES